MCTGLRPAVGAQVKAPARPSIPAGAVGVVTGYTPTHKSAFPGRILVDFGERGGQKALSGRELLPTRPCSHGFLPDDPEETDLWVRPALRQLAERAAEEAAAGSGANAAKKEKGKKPGGKEKGKKPKK